VCDEQLDTLDDPIAVRVTKASSRKDIIDNTKW